MRLGEPSTSDCEQICSFFPVFTAAEYDCGVCQSSRDGSPTPTVSPAPTPEEIEFFIELDLVDVPLSDRIYYRQARDTLMDIVAAGLDDVTSSLIPENLLPASPCFLPSVIDDLYICINVKKFDRKNENVVASSAPVFARARDVAAGEPGLPITGFISVNEDKVQILKDGGIYQDTITHEMVHVLGFGTLWGRNGLVSQEPNQCFYIGAKGKVEHQALSGCNSDVPLSGCGHWDEGCFGRELLTDTIGTNAALSRMTIAAIGDLGYAVDYTNADFYTSSDISLSCRCFRRLDENDGVEPALQTSSLVQERSLSTKGYLAAYNYAQSLLDEQEALINALGGRADLPEGIVFVADIGVNVLYMEAGKVYSVTVRREPEV